jgi:hypothetical protein
LPTPHPGWPDGTPFGYNHSVPNTHALKSQRDIIIPLDAFSPVLPN